MGLGVLRIALTGYGGPMAGVEVRARGVNLGEAGRREAQDRLARHLREVVFRERYPWVAFLEEQSRVEVVDVQLAEPVAPTPWRAAEAEKTLIGQAPSPELIARAAEAATAGAKPLKRNAYKIPLARGLVRTALHRALALPLPE